MDHYLELWLTEHEVWAEFYCVIEWACVLDWSLSLLQFPQMQRSQIKFGWISIFQINWPSFYLFLFFFIIASWLEDIVWDSLAEWRRSNSATVFSKASTRGTYWLPERLLVNCFADDRRQKSISKAHISLSEHLGIGLLSDRSSPLPLHWLSPQEESSRLQLQPLSHYANYFPAEKLHAWCPSIQRGLQFEYMHFFFSPLPPTSSLHTYEKNVYFWCTALVFILLWWGIERALTQSIYTTPFEEYAFFQWWGVKLYKCMGNTSCKKVSCAHTAMGCLEWHYHSQCIHRTSTYK